jgi:hypothetical protein
MPRKAQHLPHTLRFAVKNLRYALCALPFAYFIGCLRARKAAP